MLMLLLLLLLALLCEGMEWGDIVGSGECRMGNGMIRHMYSFPFPVDEHLSLSLCSGFLGLEWVDCLYFAGGKVVKRMVLIYKGLVGGFICEFL